MHSKDDLIARDLNDLTHYIYSNVIGDGRLASTENSPYCRRIQNFL